MRVVFAGGVVGLSSNFFVYSERLKALLTCGASRCLPGTVRGLVLEVAREKKIPTLFRCPRWTDRQKDKWSAAFLTSTSRLVMPVEKILVKKKKKQREKRKRDAEKKSRTGAQTACEREKEEEEKKESEEEEHEEDEEGEENEEFEILDLSAVQAEKGGRSLDVQMALWVSERAEKEATRIL